MGKYQSLISNDDDHHLCVVIFSFSLFFLISSFFSHFRKKRWFERAFKQTKLGRPINFFKNKYIFLVLFVIKHTKVCYKNKRETLIIWAKERDWKIKRFWNFKFNLWFTLIKIAFQLEESATCSFRDFAFSSVN